MKNPVRDEEYAIAYAIAEYGYGEWELERMRAKDPLYVINHSDRGGAYNNNKKMLHYSSRKHNAYFPQNRGFRVTRTKKNEKSSNR